MFLRDCTLLIQCPVRVKWKFKAIAPILHYLNEAFTTLQVWNCTAFFCLYQLNGYSSPSHMSPNNSLHLWLTRKRASLIFHFVGPELSFVVEINGQSFFLKFDRFCIMATENYLTSCHPAIASIK